LLFCAFGIIIRKKGGKTMEIDNKSVFATNLKRLMDLNKKSRRDISEALGISYFTITDWANGRKYPRMDKVEMLANYFGVPKSALIEEFTETQKNNDILADIIVRLRTDEEFSEIVKILSNLDAEKLAGIKGMLITLLK
jgi:transcriptional regulator with XRE-family HTH domain